MSKKNPNLDWAISGEWGKQWYWTPRINPGYDRVRRISRKHAVKTFWGWSNWDTVQENEQMELMKELHKELETQRLFYDSGITVPKPEGIFGVTIRNFPYFESRRVPGFVMQYIPGVMVDQMFRTKFHSEVDQKHREEREKAMALGYVPGEAHNAIWNPKERKVYLIDFRFWVRKK